MTDEVEPSLELFRRAPADLRSQPPLASSLQSFESCLFLLALGRYPHAFVACVFAIEGALKAGLRIPANDRVKLHELLERAGKEVPFIAEIPGEQRHRLGATRNTIVHYGFSPKDDEVTTMILLDTAVPLLAAAYEKFFRFNLYEGLLVEVGEQLV